MIVTGVPYSSSRKTEIVDLANGITCSNLAKFPFENYGAVGANIDGTPVVCAGGSTQSKSCYRFTNGVWEKFASMKDRYLADGVMYNKRLHVFGGWVDSSISQTSETINVDGEVSYGPDLPTAVYIHSMTVINDTVSLLSGGNTKADSSSAKTWYYNHDTEVFTSGPDLLEGRTSHGSATNVDRVTKAKIVVIAGGWTGGYGGNALDSTELLINGQWQPGIFDF
jgi:hypothetical protein